MAFLLMLILLIGEVSAHGHEDREDPYLTVETYPDSDFTPGSLLENITIKEICKAGYARKTRDVSQELKRLVREIYGIDAYDENYSIDHFIPLSLGGSNDITNLWPQRISGIVYGAKQKTMSDYYLYREVCDGRMTLEDAQALIRKDWVAVYRGCCGEIPRRQERRRARKSSRSKWYVWGDTASM